MTDRRASRWSGRTVFLILWGVPFGLMVLAWLVYNTGFGIPSSTSNFGTLINPPQQVSDWLPPPDEKSLGQQGTWTLILIGRGDCDENCRQRLWFTRQIHIGLGREAQHLRRVYWHIDGVPDSSLGNFLSTEHPGMVVAPLPQELARRWEQLLGSEWEQQFVLVDPAGFAMMSYDQSHLEARPVLDDLRFLLKISL